VQGINDILDNPSVRRNVMLALIIFLLITCSMVPTSGAGGYDEVTVAVDNEIVFFPQQQGPLFDINNRLLVPVRFIVDAFDSDYTYTRVDWNGEDKIVSLLLQKTELLLPEEVRNAARSDGRGVERLGYHVAEEIQIELTIGSYEATVNGVKKRFDTSPQIYNDRTMVPVRFVSEALGAEVGWDAERRQVDIYTHAVPAANPAVGPKVDSNNNERVSNRLVSNPYEGINWSTIEKHKAALHFHTDESDGFLSPAEALELYRQRGFSVLSITDHDNIGNPKPTWPWSYTPEGVLPIKGNELSYHHHITTYFTDYYGSGEGSVAESLFAIEARGGLSVFAHPGRYNGPENWDWYVPYYRQFDSLFGLEVYNMGDRFPTDRKLWDNLLEHFMPGRPIFGMANDDMHLQRTLGINWNTLLLQELSIAEARKSLEEGRFFFSYAPLGTAPAIEKVVIEDDYIEIIPEQGQVHWIANGEVIQEGNRLEYKHNPCIQNYVRASVVTGIGRTYTQPFGFIDELNSAPR